MHASRLVQLAAIVTSQHRLLCQQTVDANFWAADQFWVLHRARINEWTRALQQSESLRPSPIDFSANPFWKRSRGVIEEILFSEVCTRIWCATLSTIEQLHHPGELDPIARSVFISNLEARRRALRLLLFIKGLPQISTSTINELRRTCESWTDDLLANLPDLSLAQQYCFDRHRVQRIHESQLQRRNLTSSTLRQRGRFAAMHYYVATYPVSPAHCSELNSEIGAVILACLPVAAFDGCGTQQLDRPVSADAMSLDVLADLYGTRNPTRFDSRGGLKDTL